MGRHQKTQSGRRPPGALSGGRRGDEQDGKDEHTATSPADMYSVYLLRAECDEP